MKKNTILVIVTFLAVLGWVVSTAGGSLESLAALECCTLDLQQETPSAWQKVATSPETGIPAAAKPSTMGSDWQRAATSPETGIPATAKPSTAGDNMRPITDTFKPITEPFILLP
ncbi:MAG: hypothetical protein ACLP5H_14935 [Desulfomonilaceae bacterium]